MDKSSAFDELLTRVVASYCVVSRLSGREGGSDEPYNLLKADIGEEAARDAFMYMDEAAEALLNFLERARPRPKTIGEVLTLETFGLQQSGIINMADDASNGPDNEDGCSDFVLSKLLLAEVAKSVLLLPPETDGRAVVEFVEALKKRGDE